MKSRLLLWTVAVVAGLTAFGIWRVFLRPRGAALGPIGAIEQIAPNLYLIPGAGGNTAVFVAPSGTVVVDTKVAGQGSAILQALRTVSQSSVWVVVNTHSHGDHTGGNLDFPAGTRIIAHERCAAEMRKMSHFLFGFRARGLPTETYGDRLSVFGDADGVELYHFGPAHTTGDTFVVFPAARVMHAGDVFPFKGLPAMNARAPLAYAATLRKALDTIKNVDRVITSHRGVVSWQDFTEFAAFVEFVLDTARIAHKAGRTARETAEAFRLPDRFQGYDVQNLPWTLDLLFAELSR